MIRGPHSVLGCGMKSKVVRNNPYFRKIRPIVLARAGYKCQLRLLGICTNLLGGKMDPSKMEVDHIIPISEGGTDSLNNLQASCRACNRYKGKKFLSTKVNQSREW